MTGTELKVRRVTAHVKAKDVAAVAGWTTSKISRIESSAFVPADVVDRYVQALATCSTNLTRGAAA